MDKALILIVDDEPEICEFTKNILEKTGRFDVIVTTHPMDGINLAKKHGPDLILLDILMPEMDGSQVAEHLLDDPDTRNIPIVFVTCLVPKEEVSGHAGTIGRHFFLGKPIDKQELIARIEEILEKKFGNPMNA